MKRQCWKCGAAIYLDFSRGPKCILAFSAPPIKSSSAPAAQHHVHENIIMIMIMMMMIKCWRGKVTIFLDFPRETKVHSHILVNHSTIIKIIITKPSSKSSQSNSINIIKIIIKDHHRLIIFHQKGIFSQMDGLGYPTWVYRSIRGQYNI